MKGLLTLLLLMTAPMELFAGYYDLQHFIVKPNTTTIRNDLYLRGNIHLSSNTSTANLSSIPTSQGVVIYASGTVSGLSLAGVTSDFYLNANKKLSLIGSGGTSYLIGRSNHMIQTYTNATKNFEVGTSSITTPLHIWADGGARFGAAVYLNANTRIGYSNGFEFGVGTSKFISPAAGFIQAYTDGTRRFEIGTSSITFSQNTWMDSVLYIPTNRYIQCLGLAPIYFNSGDTFIRGQSNNMFQVNTNGVKRFEVGTSSITATVPIVTTGLSSSGNITASNYSSFHAAFGGHYYGAFKAYSDGGLQLALGGATSDGESNNNLIIGHYAWMVNAIKNYGHTTLSLNPTIFIHSVADPELDANQYLALSHSDTGADIKTGKSFLNFKVGNTTRFQVGATSVAVNASQLIVPNNFIITSPANDFMIEQSGLATTYIRASDWLKLGVYSGGWASRFDIGVSSNTSLVDMHLSGHNLYLNSTMSIRPTTNSMMNFYTNSTKRFQIGTSSTTLSNPYTYFPTDNRIYSASGILRLDVNSTRRFEMMGSSVTIDTPELYATGNLHVTGNITGTITYPPGISSMTWTRVYYNLVVTTATIITITSLDGNTAQEYKINVRLHKGHATKGSMAMGFNAGADKHSWRIMTTTTTTPTIKQGETNWGSMDIAVYDVATTTVYSLSEIYIHAKTGTPRMVNATTTIISAGAVRGTQICSGVWTDQTTNITQISFGTDGNELYGAGTIIEVWKRN